MTDTPDLSTLPQRMRYAADVQREATKRYGREWPWPLWALETYATKWEKEDRAATEREALVEELARDLYETQEWSGCAGSGWHQIPEHVRQQRMDLARLVITRGWRKGEQP